MSVYLHAQLYIQALGLSISSRNNLQQNIGLTNKLGSSSKRNTKYGILMMLYRYDCRVVYEYIYKNDLP